MIYDRREFSLKDGKICVFRSPVEEDAYEMLEYLKAVSSETNYILRYPEECTETIEQEASFLKSINTSDLNLMIVADIDGEIAGNCQIAIRKRMKARHRASVAIALKEKFWNLGIGTLMFSELEKIARDKDCKQLELEVIEGNKRAIALYEKMGFRVYARRERGVILKDGTVLAELLMVKYLDRD